MHAFSVKSYQWETGLDELSSYKYIYRKKERKKEKIGNVQTNGHVYGNRQSLETFTFHFII
jgi:hypothetical protein